MAKPRNDCAHKTHSQHSKWTLWPAACQHRQCSRADYPRPILDKYCALATSDSYLRWPEVCFTNSPTSSFTTAALRKIFSCEWVPHVLVTHNGNRSTAQKARDCLKSVDCQHVLAFPRHPQSNGTAKSFMRTPKSITKSNNASTSGEHGQPVGNFLMPYRNLVHPLLVTV